MESGTAVARLAYGPGARITRVNKGLRRRANKAELGFWIDPVSGKWKAAPGEEGQNDPTIAPHQLIVPCVRDHKNALHFQPADAALTETSQATIQHALLRGIEAVFQLEEGEVLAEPMPSRDERKGFLLYEATEGGAGVLTRLVSEPDALARAARRALAVMHFDVEDGEPLPATAGSLQDADDARCVAGCYRCLLSYYNQPDHELIDRRDEGAKTVLLRLAGATTTGLDGDEPGPEAPGGDSPLSGRPLPGADPDPLVIEGTALTLVWREHYVAATMTALPDAIAATLADRGFEIVLLDGDAAWARLAALLGRSS